ncbi:hypothetical protein NECAME_02157 [Necator americanus]|uniref:Uncharacterized protein n=1 Tax=Necator americanus TaxID=51031 RepID=W2TKE5_NECAM|nr:hypothetical protein NECAME_02157 [Necator americanus]ETN81477.1 hypothetical protein NECAME_02157 [Necator americanus]
MLQLPTGIYPIKDINKNNIRQIFNFGFNDQKARDTAAGQDITEVNRAKVIENKESTVAASSNDATAIKDDKTKGRAVDETTSAESTTDGQKTATEKVQSGEEAQPTKEQQKTAEEQTNQIVPGAPISEAQDEPAFDAAPKDKPQETDVVVKESTSETSSNDGELTTDSNKAAAKAKDSDANHETAAEVAEGNTIDEAAQTTSNDAASTRSEKDVENDGNHSTEKIEGTAASDASSSEPKTDQDAAANSSVDFSKTTSKHAATVEKKTEGQLAADSHTNDNIEGSAESPEDKAENSGLPDDTTVTAADLSTLLTGSDATKDEASAASESTPATVAGNERNSVTSSNTMTTITLPQFPGVPYVFLPVKSIRGAQLPVLSYLLVQKKYENELPEFLTKCDVRHDDEYYLQEYMYS